MNKKGKCKSTSKCKLVQMDINDSFNKWKHSQKMKKSEDKLKIFQSPLIIQILDSDSEPDSESNTDYISSIKERKLPFPFTQEEVENSTPTQIAGSPENDITTLSKSVNIGVYKPKTSPDSTNPEAYSTPLKFSQSSRKYTHDDTLNLSNISRSDTKTYNDPGLVSDTDSERTIIYQESNSLNCSDYSSNVTGPVIIGINTHDISQDGTNKGASGASSPTRERVSTGRILCESQKVNSLVIEKKHFSRKLFHEKEILPDGSTKGVNVNTNGKRDVESCEKKALKKQRVLERKEGTDESTPQSSCSLSSQTVSFVEKSIQANHVTFEDEIISTREGSEDEQTLIESAFQSSCSISTQADNIVEKSIQTIPVTSANEIISTREKGNEDKQPAQSSICTPNKDRTLLKSRKEKQTLIESASQPSCSISTSSQIFTESITEEKSSMYELTKNTQNIHKSEILLKSRDECEAFCKTDCLPSSRSPGKAKAEGKKINMKYVTLIQELFDTVYKTNNVNSLLDDDRKAVDVFRGMNMNYQYVCIKLFTWQRKWYNLFKFCDRINLNIGDDDVREMYTFLKEKRIVDTEFVKDDLRILLQLMDPSDLKSIRDIFKLKKTLINKQDIIESLLRCCCTQSTLTPKKSTLNILMGEIEQRLAYSVRLNKSFHEALYRAYILATFANSTFSKMSDYFKNVLHLRIAFPDYPVENYSVFYSQDEFVRYAKARKYRDELEDVLGKNHMESFHICKHIFEELQETKNDENNYEDRYRNTPHLIQFTARAVYVSALSSAMSTLVTKFPTDVKDWLEYMIKEVGFPHRIGDWYYHLSWIYMNYLEPRDYTHAAELIIEALLEKREHLSEGQLHHLGKRGHALTVSKKYKISQLYHDRIAELVPEPIDINGFPSTVVDASTIRSNELGRKRDYIVQDKDGNKTVLTVEYIALKHYLENGYTDGRHCEGSLVMATFTLFFWDIIYNSKEIVPGTFVSKVQSVPLDINSRYFYLNRKNAIDKRLEEIETTWSQSELVKFVKDKYEKYSHLVALCVVDTFIEDVELLEILIDCVGRVVLAKIYERFVKSIRHYRSGLPDLLIWNVHEKKSKFVEVKGENDKLSVGQTLWLNYLRSIGADIEVCMVHSIGSKRKDVQKSGHPVARKSVPVKSISTKSVQMKSPTTSFVVKSEDKKNVQNVQAKPPTNLSTASSPGGSKQEKNIPEMSEQSTTSVYSESKSKNKVLGPETNTASSSDGSKRKKRLQKEKEMLEGSSPSLVVPIVKKKAETDITSTSGVPRRKKTKRKVVDEAIGKSTAPFSSGDEFE